MRTWPLRVRVVALLSIMTVTQASGALADAFTDSQESSLFDLDNDHRVTGHNVAPFQLHDGLRDVARRQAQRIAAAGYLYHNPKLAEEVDEVLPRWTYLGENVGVDQDAASMFSAFLGSAPHHANIDRPTFDRSGIGVVPGGSQQLYFTQVFAEGPPTPRAQRAVPLRTARAIALRTVAPAKSQPLAGAVPTTPEVATPTPEVVPIVSPPTAAASAAPSVAAASRRARHRFTLVDSLLGSFREAFGRLIPG